ncbi:MAG: tetratricopeptide repeat protein, partial [Pseudomonadota bacterium]
MIEAAPDDPRIAVIETYLTYLDAVEAEDDLARGAAYAQAQELFEEDPSRFLLQRLAVDHLLRERDLEGALAAVDGSLEVEPDNRLLNDVRLSVLVELDQGEAIEGHLLTMLDRFPEDEELPATLLRYYLAIGDTDEALTFLRNQAAEATEEDVREDALVVLVRLLLETEGPDAALAELDRILAEGQASTSIFGALRASVLFDQGETETAMAELEALLEGELPVQETSRIRIALAQMLMATNNVVGARAQVEQVLEVDASQADALKMLAGWLIEEDQADRAISSLRIALDENPDDAQALTLMAQAHERNGDDNLAREFYSLAVEASDSAPAETLRYVQILMEDSRSFFTAEELLISALRLEPGQPDLMRTLGMLYLRMQDWARAEQVETTLRDAGDEISLRVATQLEVDRLAAQGRTEEAVTFLEELAGSSGIEDVGAQIAVVRARLMNGETDEALSAIEQLVAEAPEELAYRFTLAATQSATGDLEAAEATFRALTEEAPEVEQAWVGLIRILNAQGRSEEAQAVMNDALAVLPNALDLLWAQASFLERDGDIDGAIEVYELMYERVPSSEVVANNLASLLLTYRDDQESLDRAFAVARRLRNAEIPHFQDTYGWLSYRLGDYDEALAHLRSE